MRRRRRRSCGRGARWRRCRPFARARAHPRRRADGHSRAAGRRGGRVAVAGAAGEAMKILVSWSSGKDSAWMLHVLAPRSHGSNVGRPADVDERAQRTVSRCTACGAEPAAARRPAAAGLPLFTITAARARARTMSLRAAAWQRAVDAAVRRRRSRAIAFGDLFLEDVRRYREERLAGTGLDADLPAVAEADCAALARRNGRGRPARSGVTCVDQACSMPHEFAGRALRRGAAVGAAAPASIRAASAASSTPAWSTGRCLTRPLAVTAGEVVERGDFVFADLCLEGDLVGNHAANSTGTGCGISPRS